MKTQQIRYGIYVLLILASAAYASAELQYFTARNEQDAIVIEWKSGIETNLARYEVERSANNTNNFIQVGQLMAIGNNSYYFYRDEVTRNNSENPIYYYRLKMIDNNGSVSYSQTIAVAHIISGVRSTWGSIKAIFR